MRSILCLLLFIIGIGNPSTKAQVWPPKPVEISLEEPLDVPYLKQIPKVIDIRVGRQLFVDDYLIEKTDLIRKFHQPEKYQDAPVFAPQTKLEMNDGYCPLACPFNDGVFYDDNDNKFKMWYHAGWFNGTSYAESTDGINWKRLSELYPDKDAVIHHTTKQLRDGAAVWIDHKAKNPSERYKMFIFYREFEKPIGYFHEISQNKIAGEYGALYSSSNGIDWKEAGRTGPCGDNTTFFYNPFTKKWVYSIRYSSTLDGYVRIRGYREADDFYEGGAWKKEDISFWSRTDRFDEADPDLGYIPQLYDLNATPYESIMLGVHSIFLGPSNEVCEQTGRPKIIDLKISFSRDGFYWDRSNRQAFLPSSRREGSWDYGYLHASNGICIVKEDKLYFYYTAFSGLSPQFGMHMYAGGNVGLAVLRRDGFASMEVDGQTGILLTRPLCFEGKYLFVNAEAKDGQIKAELLDENNRVIKPFSMKNCIATSTNETKQRISWKGNPDLGKYSGKPVKIKFYCNNASFYSFWVSPKESGASYGYMAAGGPGFKNGIDSE